MCLISGRRGTEDWNTKDKGEKNSARKNTDMCEAFEYGDSNVSRTNSDVMTAIIGNDQNQSPVMSDPTVAGEDELMQTRSCEDDLMADNVQSFINMGVLQSKYLDTATSPPPPITINRTGPKKLLLLDMDETMLHAATLNDIYIQEMYGKEAEPSFITSFADRD